MSTHLEKDALQTGGAAHWAEVYTTRAEDEVSWFQADQTDAAAQIMALCPEGAGVIDVGGGASRLVDQLLAAGARDVSVLDISGPALAASQARLGAKAAGVTWITADMTRWQPTRQYGLWHDRAAFHFLTDPADQAAYVATMVRAVQPGGAVILSSFAEDGPERCSGLPVVRYDPNDLAGRLEALAPGAFVPVNASRTAHLTPKGGTQLFQTSVFRRV